ncbi:MAG: aminoglycoside phosphotransferase family protein [Acidobacteriota bacterium]|nr:aminoglycoside phosphotransferase family protein [Acidobacteriota bacterium]
MKFPIITNKEEFDEHFQSRVWLDAAKQICRRHQISFTRLKRSENGEHIVFLIDDSFVIKIYRPFRRCFEREKKALEFVGGRTNFKIPEIVQIGEIEGFNYTLMTQLSGVAMTRAAWLTLPRNEQVAVVAELAVGLKTIHSLDADSFDCDWSEFVEDRANTFVERQIARDVNSQVIESLPAFIETNLKLLPKDFRTVFLHGDVHFGNLRFQKSGGEWQISGLFDFADSRCGFHEYDFLAVGILMIQGQAEIQREFFKSYGYHENQLDKSFRKRLMMLTMLYETSDLRRYAQRLKPEAVDFTLEELERAIWSFAE